jgi:hypothetical protein
VGNRKGKEGEEQRKNIYGLNPETAPTLRRIRNCGNIRGGFRQK